MSSSLTSLIILCLVITTLAKINTQPRDYGHLNSNPYFSPLDIREDDSLMTNSKDYPNLRIRIDYSSVENSLLLEYVQNELMPPVRDYFQAALKIKRPLIDPITVPKTQDQICGCATPQILHTSGIEADLVLIVFFTAVKNTTFVAEATDCHRSYSGRPIIAKLTFNTEFLPLPNGDVLMHERNINLAIHEVIHTLGFSKASFGYYLDDAGNRREDHMKTIELRGENRTVLDLEPLTWRVREHFQCPSLPGALMENDGSNSTRISHFEKSVFLYEMMTSGVFRAQRISEFTFAVLEGSGWYEPNYNFAEPFFFGKDKGCEFWRGPETPEKPKEFCPEKGARGCSPTGRGGAYCLSNFKTEGYNFFYAHHDLDCEAQGAEEFARLKGKEVFGRGSGSRCFTGTLSTQPSQEPPTNFCLKFACKKEGANTVLGVKIGNKNVNCRREGEVKIPGYSGVFDCPDPSVYCNTVAKEFCPKNCMGRGECINNQCKCSPGYIGLDCSISVINTVLTNSQFI